MSSVVTCLLADAEVAADRERLGLLLDFGFLFDLRGTLLLALDSLRTRRSRACRFALRAPRLPLALGATDALRAMAFHLAVGARGARRTLAFHLAVRAPDARDAVVFYHTVGAGGAFRAGVFSHTVRAPLPSDDHRAIAKSCLAARSAPRCESHDLLVPIS